MNQNIRAVNDDHRPMMAGATAFDSAAVDADDVQTAEVRRLPVSGNQTIPLGSALGVTVPYTTFDDRLPPPRSVELETLWFDLSRDGFETTALVAVPPVPGEVARAMTLDIARTAAAVIRRRVHVVDSLGLAPSETLAAMQELDTFASDPVFVVADAPAEGTGGYPAFQHCGRVLLVVGYGHSESDAAEELIAQIGRDRVAGAVAIRPAPSGRLRRRSR
ncbi:MAG: hypothetical protein AAGG08_02960 [Actinomycetota bacterium]